MLAVYILGFFIGGGATVGAMFIAYKQSRVSAPVLRLADNLESNDERGWFALSVWNDGDAVAAVSASVTKLSGGEQSHEQELPIQLSLQGSPILSVGERGRIVVVIVDRDRGVLKIGSGGFRHLTISNQQGQIIPVSFCIRVDFINTTPPLFQERAFQLTPDTAKALLYRPEQKSVPCHSISSPPKP